MSKGKFTFFSILLLLFAPGSKADSSYVVHFPELLLENVSTDLIIETEDEGLNPQLNLNGEEISLQKTEDGFVANIRADQAADLNLQIAGKEYRKSYNPIPLWISVIPPLIAIILALILKEVITSLFLGMFFGAFLIEFFQNNFIEAWIYAFMRSIDHYLVSALSDSSHVSVIIFSLLIGGMVSVISSNGGMQGIVNFLSRYAKSAKSGQLATWSLGMMIFFDDYANTLVVGKTMRSVTDRLKISREKLAYLVDSTAAPIAAIALITTWIGAELGYIADGISNIPEIQMAPYSIFLNSLAYSYYPILALVFMLILIIKEKDFGPMLTAERIARSKKAVEEQAGDEDKNADSAKKEVTENKWLALGPILIMLLLTIAGLIYSGWDSLVWKADRSFFTKLAETIGAADSYQALLWGSAAGLISAMKLGFFFSRQKWSKLIDSAMEGIKGMIPAIAILILAWGLAEVIDDLHTAEFLSRLLSDQISPPFIPLITFILAAVIAFSTGSSWGTMAILYPLILPLSWQICELNGWEVAANMGIFFNVVSSVLAGSVLGDHCSPISDTTILSSLASDCDHIQHVRTQMPYALCVGVVACLLGTLPSAYGSPFWINLPLAILVLFGIVHFVGKPTSPRV